MKLQKIITLSTLTTILLGVGIFSFSSTKEINSADATSITLEQYYAKLDSSSATNLFTSLNSIINTGYVTCSYSNLTNKLKSVDFDSDGLDTSTKKNRIVDYYSSITNYQPDDFGKNYSSEGDTWNREHLIPKNWWGGSDSGTGRSEGGDAFNMFPADGKINNERGNLPLGKVGQSYSASIGNFSKWGTSDSSTGYSGQVFEPNDKYKGDIARAYFYFATKNANELSSGSYASRYMENDGSIVFANTQFGLSTYSINLFLEWNELDPVSDWEKERCNRIYEYQKNRNPFIDNPEWANYIWGNEPIPTITPTSVSIDKSTLQLNLGSYSPLTCYVAPFNATNKAITWSSSEPTVASVTSDGKVTALKAGNANITVTTVSGNKTATCAVTVNGGAVPVTGIMLSSSEASINIDETITLTATIIPSDATTKAVSWTSSDTNIAEVLNGMVLGKSAGTCTITCSATDGSGKTATCNVTVIKKQNNLTTTFIVVGCIIAAGVIASTITLLRYRKTRNK